MNLNINLILFLPCLFFIIAHIVQSVCMYLYTVFKIKLNSYIGSMLSCCYLKLLVGSLVYFSIRDDSYKYDQCDQLKQWYFMCIKLDVGKMSVFFSALFH